MYALRERRVHVTQEDFEMAVTKVGHRCSKPLLNGSHQILKYCVLVNVIINVFEFG